MAGRSAGGKRMELSATPAAPTRAPALARRRTDPTQRPRWWVRFDPRKRRRVTVLVHRGDPYLALLLRLQLPGCEILTADDEDSAVAMLEEHPDLIVAPIRPGSGFVAARRARPHRPPVVVLVDTDCASPTVPEGIDQILLRPFVPGELHQAVRRALGL